MADFTFNTTPSIRFGSGMLAKDAMDQTRLLVNNPRPVTEDDARAIYQATWSAP